MFTGIIDAVGVVKNDVKNGVRQRVKDGVELQIKASYKGVKKGESIAVNGACLTVERVVKDGFTVHAVETTLARTLIGEWTKGRKVNLERAMRAGDRLGGHFVQGHVDAVATIERVKKEGDAVLLDIRVPPEIDEVLVPHGSVTVDGVSLTVNALPGAGVMQVSLVPFTRQHTTLGGVVAGDRVHVEGDVLGKYVRKLCRSEQ